MIANRLLELLPEDIRARTYIGEFPSDADDCVAIVESGGPHDSYFLKGNLDVPVVKVAVRDSAYDKGYKTIQVIKYILTNHTDAHLLGVVLVGDMMYFGRDEKRRHVFQLTYKIFSCAQPNE